MSPKKSKNTDTPDTNGASTPTMPELPKMNAKELKAAFAAYEKADEEVEAAKKAVEAAMQKRSKLVQAIAEGAGNGPFSYKGMVLTATCRTSKSSGQSTWFFKGPGRSDVIEV